MKHRFAILTLVLLCAWATSAAPAFACPCGGGAFGGPKIPRLDDGPGLVAHYDAVFIADVWASQFLGTEPEEREPFVSRGVRVTVLHPVEVWKGPEVPIVYEVGGWTSCSASLEAGKRYLIFARELRSGDVLGEAGPVFQTTSCDRNILIEDGAKLPPWLEELQSWRAPGVDGPGWQSNNQLQQTGAKAPAAE